MQTVPLNDSSRAGVARLIASSHERPMDVATVLSWSKGVDKTLVPKPAEQGWLAGTPYWEQLSEAQRHEVLWQETARDVSMFILLEQTIPPLYLGYINKHPGTMSGAVYEYLMLFSKEEIVHTLMFQRYMQMAGLGLYAPAGNLHELLTVQLPAMPPEFGISATMVIEWMAELAAMHASQSQDIEPMTRAMFYEHHVDESRHIAFGRWVTESYLEAAPPPAGDKLRGLLRGLMAALIPQFTYNPEIAQHVSFAFPVAADDQARIDEVRGSASNTALNDKRFAPLYGWLRKLSVL
ncbi:MAG: diiron oxygenase [Pseudomonadota bacterium]